LKRWPRKGRTSTIITVTRTKTFFKKIKKHLPALQEEFSLRTMMISAALLVLLSSTNGGRAQNADSQPQLAALAGEYTNPDSPDAPISFYPQNGKLVVESERNVPIEMTAGISGEFEIADSHTTVRFGMDGSGQGASVTFSDTPDVIYRRSGAAVHHVFHDYQRRDVMIPMRDGVKLHTVILTAADINTPLPILLQRTPYGADGLTRAAFFRERPEMARDGYIYVAQDIRGRFKSEGQFVMMHPLKDHTNPKNTDESTDSYDTVDWLIKNVTGNNGRVGVVGTSYPGFLAMMAGIDPHPAVKAVSPQAPMIDVWVGDDFFHNGAFRQTYGYDYVLSMESSNHVTDVSYGKDSNGMPVDGYDYFLQRGSFEQDVKQSGAKMLPTWKLFLDDPQYNGTWSSRAVETHLKAVEVPTLTVGGYYDQEDMFGPQLEYKSLEPHDTGHENFLVLGPWRHGYWSSAARSLGNLDFGRPVGTEFRTNIEAPFFAHYLKNEGTFDLQNTASFQTGSNTWKHYSQFPPVEARTTSLYLAADGRLSWRADTDADPASYVSDPSNPVPYRHRPIEPTYSSGSHWYNWMAEDQRFVTSRKDVAIWKLPVLQHDLTLTGEVIADIFAATSGSDADLVVKLIDQYPDNDPDAKMRGYQLMTNMEIFRGRYLAGYVKPTALKPGAVNEFKFSMHDVDHVFKTGHTLMVQVQSTWFPLYDRNPQTFVANIMKARPEDYKAATISIYSGPEHASVLQVPLMSACGHPDCN
jgi:uncharacterized protein